MKTRLNFFHSDKQVLRKNGCSMSLKMSRRCMDPWTGLHHLQCRLRIRFWSQRSHSWMRRTRCRICCRATQALRCRLHSVWANILPLEGTAMSISFAFSLAGSRRLVVYWIAPFAPIAQDETIRPNHCWIIAECVSMERDTRRSLLSVQSNCDKLDCCMRLSEIKFQKLQMSLEYSMSMISNSYGAGDETRTRVARVEI